MIVLKILGKIIALPLILILSVLWLLLYIFMHLSGIILIPCVFIFGMGSLYFLFKTSWFDFGIMSCITVAGFLFLTFEGFIVVLLDEERSRLARFLFS